MPRQSLVRNLHLTNHACRFRLFKLAGPHECELARYIVIYRWCLESPWVGDGKGYVLEAVYDHLAVPLVTNLPHSVVREVPPPAILVSKTCTQGDCETGTRL